jgi:hypothetical protein
MVLFADGSVRFVSESAAPRSFEAMSTIAGGEPVDADHDAMSVLVPNRH